MYKEVLKAIDHQRAAPRWDGDVKEDEQRQASNLEFVKEHHNFSEMERDVKNDMERHVTHLDFVNKHRDFSKITESDLEAVFLQLKKRCPKTWTHTLETRAKELNEKFMTLKNGNPAIFIDPDMDTVEVKTSEPEVQRLMTIPGSWSMDTREQAMKLSKILRHFTIFAPLEGRPFVRAWLESLKPCFTRWILLSNTKQNEVIDTLKNFLGAFGQPGIVVCLADKGASMLEILKNAARSVEALGRGTVERHYWKRLAESSFSADAGWQLLADLKDERLTLSQLDCVSEGWLSDANDWCQIFANIVSPEISIKFEEIIKETFKTNKDWTVHPGPPKTLTRCLAKCREYMLEYENDQNLPRWAKFAVKFKNLYQRSPSKPEDFIWNVVDIARCSITVPDAGDIIKVKHIIEEHFSVIGVKNSYKSTFSVRGSGYRDLKLLIEVEFDKLQLDGLPELQSNAKFICEVQILCQAWLHNKKTTSMSYKILRAHCLRDLLYDAAKYVKRSNINELKSHKDPIEIIKNGWVNLSKVADFSNIDADATLLAAAGKGWDVAGVNMLINELGANREAVDISGATPLILASKRGRHELTKFLIKSRSNIEHRSYSKSTALILAAYWGMEGTTRILLSAGACTSAVDNEGMSALDCALEKFKRTGSIKYKRIVNLLKGENVISLPETDNDASQLNELKEAAARGSLTQYLDIQDVPHSLISQFLLTGNSVASLENLLQTLWFGGDLEQLTNLNRNSLHYAAQFGTYETVSALLELGVFVNSRDLHGTSPLNIAAKWGTTAMVRVLLEARASIIARNVYGWLPLHKAVRYNRHQILKLLLEAKSDVNAKNKVGLSSFQLALLISDAITVSELLNFGANIHDKSEGADVFEMASHNTMDRENVLSVLAEYRRV